MVGEYEESWQILEGMENAINAQVGLHQKLYSYHFYGETRKGNPNRQGLSSLQRIQINEQKMLC